MEAIRFASTDKQILATYPVMRQLCPTIRRADYVRLVKQQKKTAGFQLAFLQGKGQVISVAGFRIVCSLGWGRFLYVDDLVTEKHHRSEGAGKAMLDWLVKYARAHQCRELRLDSAITRHRAHRFYFRERMDIVSYHFRLRL